MAALRKIILPLLENLVDLLLRLPFLGIVFDICLSYGASFSRLFMGCTPAKNLDKCARPKLPLILYEFEGCPFCRRVRENLSVLRLDVVVYPCPRTTMAAYGVQESSRYRAEATKLTGKCIFPILVDPNNAVSPGSSPGKVIADSAVIVEYLWLTYGSAATKPWNYRLLGKSPPVLLSLPSLYRILPRMGILKSPGSSTVPRQLLQLISYDGCPHSRRVRECLDSWELPYEVLHSRLDQHPSVSTPTLIDPNQNVTLTTVSSIIHHVQSVYTKPLTIQAGLEQSGSNWSTYSTTGATSENGVLGNDTVKMK